MSKKVHNNLARAFSDASTAAVRNRAFALKAEQEARPNIARLFRAIADAESTHARRFLYLMRGKISDTDKNLRSALRRELQPRIDRYPDMIKDARFESKAVQKAFLQTTKSGLDHAELFRTVMEGISLEDGEDYYVCQICGHVIIGFIPENCPICHAVPGRFKKVD